jgi:hypothetical protein
MSKAPQTNEQKMAAVKGLLMQNLNGFYGNYINFVKQLPIDETLKQFAVMNADQGIMWVEQGIKKLQFQVDDLPQAPEGEPSDATKEGNEQEGNQPEHSEGSESGSPTEASGSDSNENGEEECQKEIA